ARRSHAGGRPGAPRFPYTTLFRSALEGLARTDARREFMTPQAAAGKIRGNVGGPDQGPQTDQGRSAMAQEHPGQRIPGGRERQRSEEHTSELQSRENLVCRPLPEK